MQTEKSSRRIKIDSFLPHWNLDSRTRRRMMAGFMEDELCACRASGLCQRLGFEAGGRAGIGSPWTINKVLGYPLGAFGAVASLGGMKA